MRAVIISKNTVVLSVKGASILFYKDVPVATIDYRVDGAEPIIIHRAKTSNIGINRAVNKFIKDRSITESKIIYVTDAELDNVINYIR